MSNTITQDMMPALEGVIPSIVSTSAVDGLPNVTYVSQVYYLDEHHVALSRQFFNKTVRNLTENPWACVMLTKPTSFDLYKLTLRFIESQTTGELFEHMKLQLDVIAGAQGMSDVFHLQAADVFEIVEIEKLYP